MVKYDGAPLWCSPRKTALVPMLTRVASGFRRTAPVLLGAATASLAALGARSACAEQAPPSSTSSAALATSSLDSLIGRVSKMEKELLRGSRAASHNFIVVSVSFYPSTDDPRFAIGLEACRRAKSLGVPLLLVDASPPDVREALREAGADVHEQTRKGRKGAALREAVELAHARLPEDGVICYQELEKVEMVGLQRDVASHVSRSGCDVCVPRREDTLFRRSYPIEQYHSEHFANLYLDALGGAVGLPSLDWTFGPVAFRNSAASFWLRNEGELWDAQIVPFVRAARWGGARVEVLQVQYSHPPAMKRQEECVPVWSEKRLMQLNFLFNHVGAALKEEAPPTK